MNEGFSIEVNDMNNEKSREPELGVSGSLRARGMGALSAGHYPYGLFLLFCLSYFNIFING